MKILLPIFLCLFSFTLSAQELVIDWNLFLGCDSSQTEIYNTIPTRDKGLLFVGVTYCNGDGDISINAADTLGGSNVLVGKLDSNGSLAWIKLFVGSNFNYGKDACQNQDGSYGVLVYSEASNGDFAENYGISPSSDIWILKLDSLGNKDWAKHFGSPYSDEPLSIKSTSDNGYILLGASNGSGDDIPVHYGDEFSFDWFVIKTDSLGIKQWSKDIGTSSDEFEGGSILSVNNGYYLISSTNGLSANCNDTNWHKGVYTDDDVYIIRLDSVGTELWDSSFGGTGNDEATDAFWDSEDSSIMVIGYTNSNDYFVTDLHGNYDIWVLKLSESGALRWQKTLGDIDDDKGSGIVKTKDHDYVVYGSMNPFPMPITIGVGQQDAWLFLIDSLGNELSSKLFGGVRDEESNAVIPYKNGYAIGGFTGSSSFTEGLNIYGDWSSESGYISYIDYWPLAIPEVSNNIQELSLFPNPATDEIRVIFPSNSGRVMINNVEGATLYTKTITGNVKYIDLTIANWIPGMYIIKWIGEDGFTSVRKFLKQ